MYTEALSLCFECLHAYALRQNRIRFVASEKLHTRFHIPLQPSSTKGFEWFHSEIWISLVFNVTMILKFKITNFNF